MAHRGRDTLRFGPMKPVGLDRSAHGAGALRSRPAEAGQSRRRSLQPGRVPDADQMGRTGPRAAHDSRTRAGGVRPLRYGASQHLRERTDGARRNLAGTNAADPLLCRSDVRRRGLRRVGRVRPSRRDQRRGARRWASRCSRRRGRPRLARWPTMSPTRTRRTTSPRTSRSGSCRRSNSACAERNNEIRPCRIGRSARSPSGSSRAQAVGRVTCCERPSQSVSAVSRAEPKCVASHGSRLPDRSRAVHRACGRCERH